MLLRLSTVVMMTEVGRTSDGDSLACGGMEAWVNGMEAWVNGLLWC